MNDNNAIRDGRKELGLLSYKILAVPMKWYIVLLENSLVLVVKCVLQTLGQPLSIFIC